MNDATSPETSSEDDDRPSGDMVAQVLAAARAAARAAGKTVPRTPGWTGVGGSAQQANKSRDKKDDLSEDPILARYGHLKHTRIHRKRTRDVSTLGEVLGKTIRDRGWEQYLSQGAVFAQWEDAVGEQIALHARPESLTDGCLFIVADSTAWATQLRMLQNQLITKIATTVGPDIVTEVRISGPSAPSWSHGRLRVAGRGPRDTYG